jgi:hypothetical protein
MSDTTISVSLIEQFARSWEVLRDAVRQFPAEQWRCGEIDYLIPPRLALHVIEAAEFYAGDTPEGFHFGGRFGVDWEGSPAEQFPDQEEMLRYLDEVQAQVEAWLRGLSDADLLLPGQAFPWTGRCVLDRAIYVLRHTHQHIGEMNAELRRRGCPRAQWR